MAFKRQFLCSKKKTSRRDWNSARSRSMDSIRLAQRKRRKSERTLWWTKIGIKTSSRSNYFQHLRNSLDSQSVWKISELRYFVFTQISTPVKTSGTETEANKLGSDLRSDPSSKKTEMGHIVQICFKSSNLEHERELSRTAQVWCIFC